MHIQGVVLLGFFITLCVSGVAQSSLNLSLSSRHNVLEGQQGLNSTEDAESVNLKLNEKGIYTYAFSNEMKKDSWQMIGDLLPEFVRKNPSGYSYLCRLERKIEKQTPLGVWVRVGEINPWEFYNQQNIYVQFKLFGFK